MPRNLVVIPARMASTRLPDKPMADIHGEPMIVHVWRRAMAAQIGRVIVATDSEAVAGAIRSAGGEAVMTRDDHVSGSDRIFEALCQVDPEEEIDFVVNLQGDLPTLDEGLVRACLEPLMEDIPSAGNASRLLGAGMSARQGPQIATLAVEITKQSERTNPNVVKVVGAQLRASPSAQGKRLRALYFTRATAPYGDGPLYHHIGIYAYRRNALERFVSLRPSELELRERLEQLRALEDGMRIDVSIVDTLPLGVDTPEDLERARTILSTEA